MGVELIVEDERTMDELSIEGRNSINSEVA